MALERWSLDDINRWYNTSVYQRSNKATKEWCNKQKHIGIRTLACKPARAPTCLPSSLPADRSAGVPACRHTDRRTCRQAIRKRAGSNMMWKRYGIKSKTVLPIFISKMCNKRTIMIRCLIYSIFQRNNFGNEREKHYLCKWEKRSFDWCRTLQNREARWFPSRYLSSWHPL